MAPQLGYRAGLDGIRAIAILAVIGLHAFNRPTGGFWGVDLFFVLSGFLITSLLVEEYDREGSISFRRFYERRARRLLPALVVLIAVVLPLAAVAGRFRLLGDVNAGYTIHSGLLSLIYALNLNFAAGGSYGPLDALAHLWSLSEEEQFYVLWPFILLFLLRGVRRRLMPYVLVLLLVAAELNLLRVSAHHSYPRIYFGPDTHVISLLAGCLLAFVPARVKIGSLPALLALAVFGWIAFHTISETHTFVHYDAIIAAASCVIILGARDAESRFSRGLAWAPIALLGRLSYSIYLWHFPMLMFFPWSTAVALLVSFAAAVASYRYVERPFRRRRSKAATPVTTAWDPGIGLQPRESPA